MISIKTAAADLGAICNSGNITTLRKEFAEAITDREHRTLQQCIFALFVACIRKWAEAYRTNRYDARNEATVRLCDKIVTAFDDELDNLPYI